MAEHKGPAKIVQFQLANRNKGHSEPGQDLILFALDENGDLWRKKNPDTEDSPWERVHKSKATGEGQQKGDDGREDPLPPEGVKTQ